MMKSTLCTLVTWSIGFCYGFVLLSSAAGQNGDINLFPEGESLRYSWRSSVFLNEKDGGVKDVGFLVSGEVIVSAVWSESDKKLLKIELKSSALNVKSRKVTSGEEFTTHSSTLDNAVNQPFLILWENGKINEIFVSKNENTSILNLKKGIASLFQFQPSEGDFTEVDASGECLTTFSSVSPTKLLKVKNSCSSKDLEYLENPDEILGAKIQSSRQTQYDLDSNLSHLKYIKSKELHLMYFSLIEKIGSQVEAEQILSLIGRENVKSVEGNTVEQVIEHISTIEGLNFVKENLLTNNEKVAEDKATFAKQVDSLRNYLKASHLGNGKPVKAFLKLVSAGKSASRDAILKALQSKKNKDILPQLYDILGYVQTEDSHTAVTKTIHWDKEDQIDLNERYLWALSFSPHPNPEIIKDILKKFNKADNIPEKVEETVIQTLASMAHKLAKTNANTKVVKEVEEAILNNLEYAKNEERYKFFRALQNLRSPDTIQVLLKHIESGTSKETVLAWKAIRAFPKEYYDEKIQKAARKTLLQLNRKYDSSSRALAVDILLDSESKYPLLEELLNFVASNDTAYEIRQYTFQKINMIASEDPYFNSKVQDIIKKNPKINNYSGLSPQGLSTALSRRFLSSPSTNGSLVSLQEIKSGIVKRGAVDVVLEKEGITKELFSLGLYSGGLSSFMSSSDGEEEDVEEESVTGGMELTFMGTQIRPFVFFSGQGELMGHVWSGTASEKTPAFQMLALLQNHNEYLRLGSGFVPSLYLKGALSFDLSGKIEMSLWNRNAESLIEKTAGVVMIGGLSVDTSFVKTQVELSAIIDTQLNLQSDIDFSSNVKVCMRLNQPDMVFRHSVVKTEHIPGSKYNLRVTKNRKTNIPGITYAINRKNNEMCSAMFS